MAVRAQRCSAIRSVRWPKDVWPTWSWSICRACSSRRSTEWCRRSCSTPRRVTCVHVVVDGELSHPRPEFVHVDERAELEVAIVRCRELFRRTGLQRARALL